MTPDLLDRVRAADPVAHGSSAPPLEWMLERIAAAPHAEPSRHRSLTAAVVPLLGAAAAIVVVALAFVLHVGGRSATISPTTPAAPVAGMRGVVDVSGFAFASADRGMISFEQCWPCNASPQGGRQVFRNWLAFTANGGRSWQISHAPSVVSHPQFDAAGNGWAQGVSDQRVARFYVTHNEGRTWTIAPSASPSPGLGPVSIAGGEVWSMGEGCQPTCNATIVHGAASGSRLTATAAQPVSGDALNLEVVAASAGVAYVINPQKQRESFVTHDDGRSWQRFSAPCPRLQEATGLTAGGSESLWDSCQRRGGSVVRRSVDGGRHWSTYPITPGTLRMLQPVSAEVAWGQTTNGHIVRTTNGGGSWSTVWKVGGSQTPTLAGHSPMLITQNTTTAAVLLSLTHGHVGQQAKYTNLVTYRTTNGGATWQPSVVRLPAH